MAKKRKVVTIKRSRWASAKRLDKWNDEQATCGVEPALYIPANKMMCCLGFVCRAEGLSVSDIKDVALPTHLSSSKPVPSWLAAIESDAAGINDDTNIDDRTREAKLKKLFRERSPVDLKFVP